MRRHASRTIGATTAAKATVLEGNELLLVCGKSGVKCNATNGRGTYCNSPEVVAELVGDGEPQQGRNRRPQLPVPNPEDHQRRRDTAPMQMAVTTTTNGRQPRMSNRKRMNRLRRPVTESKASGRLEAATAAEPGVVICAGPVFMRRRTSPSASAMWSATEVHETVVKPSPPQEDCDEDRQERGEYPAMYPANNDHERRSTPTRLMKTVRMMTVRSSWNHRRRRIEQSHVLVTVTRVPRRTKHRRIGHVTPRRTIEDSQCEP